MMEHGHPQGPTSTEPLQAGAGKHTCSKEHGTELGESRQIPAGTAGRLGAEVWAVPRRAGAVGSAARCVLPLFCVFPSTHPLPPPCPPLSPVSPALLPTLTDFPRLASHCSEMLSCSRVCSGCPCAFVISHREDIWGCSAPICVQYSG